jgi:hypothetical protein
LLRLRLVIILVTLVLCLTVSGCTSPSPAPSSEHGTGQGTNSNTDNNGGNPSVSPSDSPSTGSLVPDDAYTVSGADVTASLNAVVDAASAIQFNDPAAFTGLMSADTISHVSGTPDLTTPEAKKIGEALQNAVPVKAEKDAFIYETTMDGVQISFLVIKEGGAWKISGL